MQRCPEKGGIIVRQQIRIAALAFCLTLSTHAQVSVVRGRVEVEGAARTHAPFPSTVIWLTPVAGDPPPASDSAPVTPRLTQRNKSFEPHLLVVPAGAAVEFPNRDPFFHNVFSLFEGKRFDLGLYEAGSTRMVHFDRPGISYIFCNIHPEMSGVVITLTTPFHAVANSAGRVSIAEVPPGRYLMQVWFEGGSADSLKSLSREVTISGREHSLGAIRVTEDSPPAPHKNKYGRDYDAPGSDYPPMEPR